MNGNACAITNAEVHEVISAFAGPIKKLFEHGLINAVWDIAQHDLQLVSKRQGRHRR